MRMPFRKLKTPIISKQGKGLLLLATTCKIVEELRRELCIGGHHIYKVSRNVVDQYSVAITKRGVSVKHSQ